MRTVLAVVIGLVCVAIVAEIAARVARRRRGRRVVGRLETAERDIQEHKARLAAAGRTRSCSFCGKPADRVAFLIALPDVAICDVCVEVCQRKVHRDHRRLAGQVES